ncbi:pyridoxal phosphate-dependent aminotransferase [Phaeobacter inhibens]|uniref:pyridoxal phosphate-dependent aminotransferase n=1 Tax=Phaeobacter inhibens TaxID=221822 RepID=UPI000C99CC39|nr:pyridoxal phosphate-dependent aminotransferase [Phaeobacter inhibens]AUQ64738.1 putative aspartate aminotransferase [Phaeobacter inhibens]AUQ84576.1 putative aspartate aminotransferase [Phaeobacter inhibens]AUQ92385.1 putative aspartate aminotransferase [Phaeobacter inhibens]MDO6757472.1 pyridoxal phosphate-dependent aminotransferase [Phaeobacter inhibens]
MRMTDVTRRLAGLGGAKWEVHLTAREMIAAGADIIEMTIGEPDVPTPEALMQTAGAAMMAGRTGYSDGRGEANLRQTLAERYSASTGRAIGPDNVLCFPGTQTALYAVLMGVAEHGDEVLVGDPMYATYEGVIRASGADMVPVPLRPEHGFRMQANDIAEKITPRSRAILLTTPHNPTGSILTVEDLDAIGRLADVHDLWIISDEVYEQLVFDAAEFVSPLARAAFADRVIVVSSISKSHAAPGFRSGWCIASTAFCDGLLPLSETMLFGNQPFIADMTEQAVREGSPVAEGMRARFAARAAKLAERLHRDTALRVHSPEAGMFAMINVAATGLDGDAYAQDLLHSAGVAVMPGSSFGESLRGWVRVALTIEDDAFDRALTRIVDHANRISTEVA